MKSEELKKLLKENRICFYSYWSKQKLIDLARINNYCGYAFLMIFL